MVDWFRPWVGVVLHFGFMLALVGVVAGIQAIRSRWFPRFVFPRVFGRSPKRDTAIGIVLFVAFYTLVAWWGGPRGARRLVGIAALFVIGWIYQYVFVATMEQLERDKPKAAWLVVVGLILGGLFILDEVVNMTDLLGVPTLLDH